MAELRGKHLELQSQIYGRWHWEFPTPFNEFIVSGTKFRPGFWRELRIWMLGFLSKVLSSLMKMQHIHHREDFTRFFALAHRLTDEFEKGIQDILDHPTQDK